MTANVTKGKTAQKSITKSMNRHVTVRVSDKTEIRLDIHATEPHLKARTQLMHIITVSDPYRAACQLTVIHI